VGHAQGELGTPAVAQPEHLLADRRPAPALVPQLLRLHGRHQELLRTGPGHLLADDLDDLGAHPDRQRQEAVVPCHQLADEPGPQQEPVADRVGARGHLAQRGDVEL
jgi:hypothetical protein